MPEMASIIIRRCTESLRSSEVRCAKCKRTPLAGEELHEMDTGDVLCDLCLAVVPPEDRRAVRSDRVHANERPLPVAPA